MSVPLPLLLLTFLALSACRGCSAAVVPTPTLLEESIELLARILAEKVSCDKMNVTNIFASNKVEDEAELLCRATTITWESRSCHLYLEGICHNLLRLVELKTHGHKAPCPVGAGDTTSLTQFLVDLQRLLQRLLKDQSLK